MKAKQIKLTILSLLVAFTTSFAGSYKVDKEASSVKWTGKKVNGEHYGGISVQNGEVEVKDGKVTAGTFVVDMNSMTCDDLTGNWNEKLIGHLKSDDFFSVEDFPTSQLVIKSVESKSGGSHTFSGTLTIKGKPLPISFDGSVDLSNEKLTATGTIIIDRTTYDIRYGSGKFFDNLGDRMIRDEFTLEYSIVATQ